MRVHLAHFVDDEAGQEREDDVPSNDDELIIVEAEAEEEVHFS